MKTENVNRHFDSAQLEVINISGGRHLVLAAPGCGKTAILTERVRRAVENGVDPSDMLCLTFTNRAARGMEERINSAGVAGRESLFVGNTHRFCGRFLFDNNLVERSTEILDEESVFSIIEEQLEEFADMQASGRDIRKAILRVYNLSHLINMFSYGMPNDSVVYAVNHAQDGLRELCAELGMPATRSSVLAIYNKEIEIGQEIKESPLHSVTLAFLELAARYENFKNENHLMDFDDLLVKVYKHLRSNPGHKRYPWIQVDEVQDLNPLQLALVEELADNSGTTLFLGDDRQAIFSFMGAKSSTLQKIITGCGNNIHRLEKNYRSPGYMIDMLNDFARTVLGTPEQFLPVAVNNIPPEFNALSIYYSRSTATLPAMVAALSKKYSKDEKTAVIVATNAAADEVSDAMNKESVAHFKISGQDYFNSVETAALLSLVAVVTNESTSIAWTKLLFGLRIYSDVNKCRRAVFRLFKNGISPADFIRYGSGSSLTHFSEAFENQETPVVIFDTETSGLDTHTDDIIQIAAVKTLGGEIVDRCNIFLKTEKEIPPMLGDIPNPLVGEYDYEKALPRDVGLRKFLDFATGCTLVGHNAFFDYSILRNNVRRDCGLDLDKLLKGELFDTLQLTRLLHPGIHSYKLKDILSHFGLEGENSHLADDDILATLSLCRHIHSGFNEQETKQRHLETLEAAAKLREKIRESIGGIYEYAFSMRDRLYAVAPLANFVRLVADKLISDAHLNLDRVKTEYFIRYLKTISADTPCGLRESLEKNCADLQTLREADLCDSSIVDESIYVTTLHKAKGLEFDNVIIYNVIDGIFPFFYSETEEERNEDARKLYVALSRARKRLVLAVPRLKIVNAKNGNTYSFNADLSPFIRPITGRFKTIG